MTLISSRNPFVSTAPHGSIRLYCTFLIWQPLLSYLEIGGHLKLVALQLVPCTALSEALLTHLQCKMLIRVFMHLCNFRALIFLPALIPAAEREVKLPNVADSQLAQMGDSSKFLTFVVSSHSAVSSLIPLSCVFNS